MKENKWVWQNGSNTCVCAARLLPSTPLPSHCSYRMKVLDRGCHSMAKMHCAWGSLTPPLMLFMCVRKSLSLMQAGKNRSCRLSSSWCGSRKYTLGRAESKTWCSDSNHCLPRCHYSWSPDGYPSCLAYDENISIEFWHIQNTQWRFYEHGVTGNGTVR